MITKGELIEFCERLKRVSGIHVSVDSLVRTIAHLFQDLPNWQEKINKDMDIVFEDTYGTTFEQIIPDEVSFAIIKDVPPLEDYNLIYSVTHYCDIRRYVNENESK